MGTDGSTLLTALYADTAPPELCAWPAVEVWCRVWVQNFMLNSERLVGCEHDHTPPTGRTLNSPDDSEASYALKRQTSWTSSQVHLTETCDDAQPNLITNVASTVASTTAAVADDAVTQTIHASLSEHHLLPDTHIADTGFVNSELFLSSRES